MLFNRSKPATPTAPAADPPKVDPPPADPPVSDPPATDPPQFVSKDEFTQLQASIYELKDNVTNFFMRQNQPAQSAAQDPPRIQIEDVTDEEYEDALAGNITDKRKVRQIVEKRHKAERLRDKLELQQQLAQLQSVGMGAISNLTAQGLQSKTHYKTYKKEIDAAIAQLPPEARVNAEALNGVYNYIIGTHIDEIMAQEREAVLRQAAPKPDTGVPSSRTQSPGTPSKGIPSPTDALEPLALAAIRDKYGSTSPESIERFVRSQGQKTWDEYYTKFLKPFEDASGHA